jgi:hypothetical protein
MSRKCLKVGDRLGPINEASLTQDLSKLNAWLCTGVSWLSMFSGGFFEHGNKPSGPIKDGELLTIRVTVPSLFLMTGLGFVGIRTKINLTFTLSYV